MEVRKMKSEFIGSVYVDELPRKIKEEFHLKPTQKIWVMRIDNYIALQMQKKEAIDNLVSALKEGLAGVTYEEIKNERKEEDVKRDEKIEKWEDKAG